MVNLLIPLYKKLDLNIDEPHEEAEKNLAKILQITDRYDITDAYIEPENVTLAVGNLENERSEYCNELKNRLNGKDFEEFTYKSPAFAILEGLKKLYPGKNIEYIIQKEIEKRYKVYRSTKAFGGGSKFKDRRRSKKRKSKRRKSKRRKTRRKKR